MGESGATGETVDGCDVFNQEISGWDVHLVTDVDNVFEGCAAFYDQFRI